MPCRPTCKLGWDMPVLDTRWQHCLFLFLSLFEPYFQRETLAKHFQLVLITNKPRNFCNCELYLKLGMGDACAGQTNAKESPDFRRIFWPSFSLVNLGGVLPIGSKPGKT